MENTFPLNSIFEILMYILRVLLQHTHFVSSVISGNVYNAYLRVLPSQTTINLLCRCIKIWREIKSVERHYLNNPCFIGVHETSQEQLNFKCRFGFIYVTRSSLYDVPESATP